EERTAEGCAGGLSGVMEYASDLCDRGSVEALAGRLVRLLEAAVAAPEVAIGRLDILSAAERHTILRDWNATERALPAATLPQLFAAQAAATPDAVAVRVADEQLRYGAVRGRAHQPARQLRARGGAARRAGGGWREAAWRARWSWWLRASPSPRRAAPICRSPPATRASV